MSGWCSGPPRWKEVRRRRRQTGPGGPEILEEIHITLLLKIGVAASIASVGVRSDAVKRMLLREERTLAQRVRLALWFAAIFMPGVWFRIMSPQSYSALDLALEGSLLAGITGGYLCGWFAGMAIAIPAMFHHELVSLPFFAVVGLGGGLLRDAASDTEDIWRISSFPDANIRRIFEHSRELRSALFHLFFFFAVIATELLRQILAQAFAGSLFSIARLSDPPLRLAAVYASTYFCVTVPLKVWNNTRNEVKLEEQERLLFQARLGALASQINPHFLFNTLNSVSTLIRINPEQARLMVTRLARIMRGRLRNQDHFAPLRDEIAFIDDYLSIELVRFGDKLHVEKSIDPATLDMLVPSMLLQPLIENSIKHGISGKIDGGTITVRTARSNGRLSIEVEDDGVGIPEADLAGILNKGIGVSNVRERLKVLYNQDYRMLIDSQPGRGTRIEIEVPGAQTPLAVVS
ncbi:MAG: histidine kinase [Acidobacteriota bacterium]|nr:histidine kinase [Acidobacteriota bacterium]